MYIMKELLCICMMSNHLNFLQMFDGWILNGDIFPSSLDHSLPVSERYVDYCTSGTAKGLFQSSQNVAMMLFRVHTARKGFSVTLKKHINPFRESACVSAPLSRWHFDTGRQGEWLETWKPFLWALCQALPAPFILVFVCMCGSLCLSAACNIISQTPAGSFTMVIPHQRRNCSFSIIYPVDIEITKLSLHQSQSNDVALEVSRGWDISECTVVMKSLIRTGLACCDIAMTHLTVMTLLRGLGLTVLIQTTLWSSWEAMWLTRQRCSL